MFLIERRKPPADPNSVHSMAWPRGSWWFQWFPRFCVSRAKEAGWQRRTCCCSLQVPFFFLSNFTKPHDWNCLLLNSFSLLCSPSKSVAMMCFAGDRRTQPLCWAISIKIVIVFNKHKLGYLHAWVCMEVLSV